MKRARPRPLRFRVDEGLALMEGAVSPSPRLDRARNTSDSLDDPVVRSRRMSYSPSSEEKCRRRGLPSQAAARQRVATFGAARSELARARMRLPGGIEGRLGAVHEPRGASREGSPRAAGVAGALMHLRTMWRWRTAAWRDR